MTTFPLRLTLAAASAVVLSACQHLPEFLKPTPQQDSAVPTAAAAAAPAVSSSSPAAIPAPAPPVPQPMPVVEAQNRWWERLRVGTLYCDLGASIEVEKLDTERAVEIQWLKKKYALHKVSTTTGAYRYEDKVSGLTLIQIPTKTILLNAKAGQRLADECNNDNRPTAAPAAETPTRRAAAPAASKNTAASAKKNTTKPATSLTAKKKAS